MSGARDRRGAERGGRRAEALAALLLQAKGYRILARRLRTPVGEIDLVARRGDVLVAVEVKARGRPDDAAQAIAPRQWGRLARALDWARAGRPDWAGLALRFDAVLLAPWRVPRHVADAWRPDGKSLG